MLHVSLTVLRNRSSQKETRVETATNMLLIGLPACKLHTPCSDLLVLEYQTSESPPMLVQCKHTHFLSTDFHLNDDFTYLIRWKLPSEALRVSEAQQMAVSDSINHHSIRMDVSVGFANEVGLVYE